MLTRQCTLPVGEPAVEPVFEHLQFPEAVNTQEKSTCRTGKTPDTLFPNPGGIYSRKWEGNEERVKEHSSPHLPVDDPQATRPAWA